MWKMQKELIYKSYIIKSFKWSQILKQNQLYLRPTKHFFLKGIAKYVRINSTNLQLKSVSFTWPKKKISFVYKN